MASGGNAKSDTIITCFENIRKAVDECVKAVYPTIYTGNTYVGLQYLQELNGTFKFSGNGGSLIIFNAGAYENGTSNKCETLSAETYKENFKDDCCSDIVILYEDAATYVAGSGYDYSGCTELGRIVFGAVDSTKIAPKVGEETASNDQMAPSYKLGFYLKDDEGMFHDLNLYYDDAMKLLQD